MPSHRAVEPAAASDPPAGVSASRVARRILRFVSVVSLGVLLLSCPLLYRLNPHRPQSLPALMALSHTTRKPLAVSGVLGFFLTGCIQ